MTGLGQMTVLWFDRLARLLVWISAAMATVMMLTIFTNVVMRYVFRSPPRGAFEIIEITMGLLVFFALPLMIRQSGNIRVTILFDRFAEPVRRWATFATELLGTAICTFIAWRRSAAVRNASIASSMAKLWLSSGPVSIRPEASSATAVGNSRAKRNELFRVSSFTITKSAGIVTFGSA